MELTITEISQQTGLTIPHLLVLIKRGRLPAGRKSGKKRFLPAEVVDTIRAHEKARHWSGSRPSGRTMADLIGAPAPKAKRKPRAKKATLADLL